MKNLVIVGGGLAGSLLALIVAKKTSCNVTMIESSQFIGKGGIGGESLTPSIVGMLSEVLPNIKDWLTYSDAYLKWGSKLVGWGPEDIYIPQYVGKDCRYNHNIPLFLSEHPDASLSDIYKHCTPAVAYMRKGILNVSESEEDWSVNLDSGKLTEYIIKELGRLSSFKRLTVEKYTPIIKDGKVHKIAIDPGGEVKGDLYVDATGPSRGLISCMEGLELKDVSDVFINNAVVHGYIKPLTDNHITSYTGAAGWQWCIPLSGRASVGYVFNSSFISKEEAADELSYAFPGVRDLSHMQFKPTRLRNPWIANVVTIGSGQGIVDPLQANILLHTKIHINSILDFLNSGAGVSSIQAYKFNIACNDAWEGMASFLELHYRGCSRRDTKYWRHVTSLPVSGSPLRGFLGYNTKEYNNRGFDWEKWSILAKGLRVLNNEDLLR